MEQTLDISWKTILRVFLAGVGLYILFLAKNILIWFFFGLVISIILEPVIKFLRWFRIPKILAVTLVYLSVFGLLGLIIYITAPVFVFELYQFANNIPDYFERINPFLRNLGFNVEQNFQDFNKELFNGLQESSAGIVRAISVFFGGLSSAIFIFSLAFFLSLEERSLQRFLALLLPDKYEEKIITLYENAQSKVIGWFGARLLACLFVGILSFVVLFLLDVKYALTFSFLSGVLNIIPFIGPLISAAIVFVSVIVSDSLTTAVYVMIAFIIIQQIENFIITPLLMKKIIDLPPVLVLTSLMIGGTIFGLLGLVFMVPVFGIAYEFLKEFLEKRKSEASA